MIYRESDPRFISAPVGFGRRSEKGSEVIPYPFSVRMPTHNPGSPGIA